MYRYRQYKSSVNNIPIRYCPQPSYHDPSNFRDLEIFPKKEDLIGYQNVQLIPNIIEGAYPSVEHYLDLQFRLLREDYFGPLREGIGKYIRNPSQQKYDNIRVYPNVKIVRVDTSRNKVGYLINIAWKEKMYGNGSVNCKKYADSKWLMCGSLCLFTNDNFQNILCASVLDSSLELLRSGFILVTFESPVSSEIFTKQYIMIESEVFFEPYHRVLKVLQNSGSDIPMSRYIVDVQKETRPPAYLSPNINYSIYHTCNKIYTKIAFPVLNTHQWPTEKFFNLDKSQLEAYKLALTREFAVIQGPPGTGKTFIGIKIASTLLRNLSLVGTPMLIICLTNHALDQFLEGILKETKAVVRLGSQSKSKILEPYNLNNLRLNMKTKYSREYAIKRTELVNIFVEITKIQAQIKKGDTELIDYVTLKPYLKIDDRILELNRWNENALLNWLLERLNDMDLVEKLNDLEKKSECLRIIYKIDNSFFKEWVLKRYGGQQMFDNFQNKMNRIKQRLVPYKTYVSSGNVFREMRMHSYNLYELNFFERWQLYFKAVEEFKDYLTTKMNTLLDRYNFCSEKLEELKTLVDIEVMRSTRVVGLTTTVAARRHDLCNKLRSPIVIVEEAAEVLEAHVVASLTRNCQHLILIGDHKQLRPSAAHYKLAKHYNLEISLFERMIRNNVHSRTLTTQRRMRPNFVQLLVPIIYERLDCHPDVTKYPPVDGMRDTLFFFNHNTLEDRQVLETSHKNSFEARWCAALANYLRKMKYKAKEITILATYNAQAALITEISKKYPLLNEVKITVVDNYQGEENRIIILSLVRSNREGKIGFLSAANRICVALSRAREGFYMFGNMNVLESASPIWRSIHSKLIAQNAIGDAITVRVNYKDMLDINNIEELDKLANYKTVSDYIDIQLGMQVIIAMFAIYIYSYLFNFQNKYN